MLGNLRDNGTLIVGEDDNNSLAGSAERSTEISTRDYFTFVGREEFLLAMIQTQQ